MPPFDIQQQAPATHTWNEVLKWSKPGPFSKLQGKPVDDQMMQTSKAAFGGFLAENLAALGQSVKLDDWSLQFVQQSFDKIVDGAFAPIDQPLSKADAHARLQAANDAAVALLKAFGEPEGTAWVETVDAASRNDAKAVKTDLPTAQAQLHQYLQHRLAELQHGVRVDPRLSESQRLEQLGELRARVDTLELQLRRQLASHVPVPGDAKSMAAFMQEIRQVQISALNEFLALDAKFAPPDLMPGLHLAPGESPGGAKRLVAVRKAPTIENLVLAGGGGKGVGNPPALQKLAETGLITGLKQVVGTSAGALTASLLASGLSADEIADLLDHTDIDELKQGVPGFHILYPGFTTVQESFPVLAKVIKTMTGEAQNPGQVALQTLDKKTADSVHAFVRDHKDEIRTAADLGRISAKEAQYLLEKFERAPHYRADRSGHMVTFKDLALLHQVAPERFKELTLTGWNKSTQKAEYFNAQNTPDMPVAFAGRISMSIPVYFQTAEYKGNRYMDGGVTDNLPANEVLKGLEGLAREEAMARTMLMVFDDKGKAHKTQFTSGNLGEPRSKLLPDVQLPSVEGLFVMASSGANGDKTAKADRIKAYESGPNVHIVFHGDLETFSLDPSPEQKALAKQTATLRTLQQIEARLAQAYSITVPDAKTLYGLLTHDEKVAILAHGEPERQMTWALQASLGSEVSDPDAQFLYEAQRTLYEMAQADMTLPST